VFSLNKEINIFLSLFQKEEEEEEEEEDVSSLFILCVRLMDADAVASDTHSVGQLIPSVLKG